MPFPLRFLRILAPWLRISIHVRVLAVFDVAWAPANGFRNGVALVDVLFPRGHPLTRESTSLFAPAGDGQDEI